jgi:hypothetical protein
LLHNPTREAIGGTQHSSAFRKKLTTPTPPLEVKL